MSRITLRGFFLCLIRLYQLFLAPFFPKVCRFYPSCSVYAELAFKRYPLNVALLLTLLRICRCNPLFEGGYDPPWLMAEKFFNLKQNING